MTRAIPEKLPDRLKKTLKAIWKKANEIGERIARPLNRITGSVLYFGVFGFYAVSYRLMVRLFSKQPRRGWIKVTEQTDLHTARYQS